MPIVMDEMPTEPATDDPMLAGMEGLVAMMKGRGAAPLERDIGNDSTQLPGARGESADDELAAAPWDAIVEGTSEPAVPLERGSVVGRYVVLQRLGAGGMGVVHAAYDPELDRKVALKLLLPGVGGGSARTRLLREAQTLAKLSHPSVVSIHDVGTVDEQVWLAMEFVQGRTLREWLASPRSWLQVVVVMRSAGEGLAAAHALELLHRDFKPDNVMIGDDGRVRVMDFGLARLRSQVTLEPQASVVAPAVQALAIPITRAGAAVGTPGYMAPEQLDGTELGPASDQFAFCVTLWEALYGERPFGGATWMELVANVCAGRMRSPPRDRHVPSWLRRACERGLSLDPTRRWPSMHALLDALATGRARVRARRGLVALGVVALGGVGLEGHRRVDLAQRTAACEEIGNEVETAWSPDREQALRDALLATGATYAATTVDEAIPWLEQRAEAWREARVSACLAVEVQDRWDAKTQELSLWCLDERHAELRSLVDELTRVDAQLLPNAVVAAAGLPAVGRCTNDRALERLPLPPAEEREAIRAVRTELTEAGSLLRAARYDQGYTRAASALANARTLEWRPLSASAHLQLGVAAMELGRHSEAELELEEAYFAADGVAPELAFHAATALVLVVGRSLERHVDGKRWARMAEARLAELHDDGLFRAGLQSNLAVVHEAADELEPAVELLEQALAAREGALGTTHPDIAAHLSRMASIYDKRGDFERSQTLLERALAIQDEAFGPGHPASGVTLTHLAYAREAQGDYAGAEALHERGLAIKERALGPTHPSVATSLNGLALLYETTGDYARAELLLTRALAIASGALGPDHPRVAETLNNLALVHQATGEHDQAKALLERALAIHERTFGPRHTKLVAPLHNLALSHQATGDHAEAKRSLERALDILGEAYGPDHPERAGSLDALATSHLALGAYDEAKALNEQALAIHERALGPSHPLLADSLAGLADVALAQGRPSDAAQLAARAVTLREQGGVDAEALAEARFLLARALWDAPADQGRDRSRAMALAMEARVAYRKAGTGRSEALGVVEAWVGSAGVERAAE